MIDQDLIFGVRPQGLGCQTRGLNYPFENDNYLQMIHRAQFRSIQLIEWTSFFDAMSDANWHDQNHAIRPIFVSAFKIALPELVALVDWIHKFIPVELQSDVSLYHLRLTQVCDSHLKVLVSIFLVDNGLLAENDCSSSVPRSRYLCKDETQHNCIDEDTDQTLHDQNEASKSAVLGDMDVAITDGDLCLEGEQKSRVEVGYVHHTRTIDPTTAVHIDGQDPNTSEEEPGENVRCSKDQYNQPPRRVDNGGEVIKGIAEVVSLYACPYHLSTGRASIDNSHVVRPTQRRERKLDGGGSWSDLCLRKRRVGVDGVCFHVIVNQVGQ